ncbi:MAG TPA: CDP-alcohol phosphatidyltransferase family protein, partial [Bdellovibrionota bacterium]|nr:CDP-alcohol phosphatidyltransferase family protein [Bdellovibrionota bacterium]
SVIGKNNFILLMSDHLFDPKIVAQILNRTPPPGGALLAVDSKIDRIFDIEDATKTEIRDGKITNIGKTLSAFNAVDTGIFHCTPGIFDALKQAGPAPSLSEGFQLLASRNLMVAGDIKDLWWQDVDTPSMLKFAEGLLFKSLRKPTDGIISRNINRPISIVITRALIPLKISPNVITLCVTILGLFTAYLCSSGESLDFLLTGILFQLTSILDGCDGEMAKLMYRASPRGAWLDTLGDNLSYIACFIGLAIGLFTRTHAYLVLGIGALSLILLLLFFIISYRWLHAKGNSGSLVIFNEAVHRQLNSMNKQLVPRILSKIQFMVKRDFFAFIIFLAALVDQLAFAFIFFTLLIQLLFWTTISLRWRLSESSFVMAK